MRRHGGGGRVQRRERPGGGHRAGLRAGGDDVRAGNVRHTGSIGCWGCPCQSRRGKCIAHIGPTNAISIYSNDTE